MIAARTGQTSPRAPETSAVGRRGAVAAHGAGNAGAGAQSHRPAAAAFRGPFLLARRRICPYTEIAQILSLTEETVRACVQPGNSCLAIARALIGYAMNCHETYLWMRRRRSRPRRRGAIASIYRLRQVRPGRIVSTLLTAVATTAPPLNLQAREKNVDMVAESAERKPKPNTPTLRRRPVLFGRWLWVMPVAARRVLLSVAGGSSFTLTVRQQRRGGASRLWEI